MRGPVIRDVPRCVLHGRSREKVPRTATADDIKKSFREPAKKLHPDVNRNGPHAAALFAELNSDHEILSDEVKRHAFDRRKIAAEGRPIGQMPACHALVPLCDWCGLLALGSLAE